ncbi:MAG: cupin domain-containing protein [Candidatus Omnitrophica bacterium]|nr:cupin domain-containing protein [Candidatus Omnitrophota bacterium]
MKRILQPPEGEVLKLGSPCAGEVIIKIDPAHGSSPCAAGTQTLSPGVQIPVHRHLHADRILFVHKGQGRAVVDQQATTVLPGMMVFVPQGAWHSLRNTGTGTFQVVWVATPAGIERFFRELAQVGGPVDLTALQSIAQRHAMEFQTAGGDAPTGPASPSGRHRRHRGRGRRGVAPVPPVTSRSVAPKPQTSAALPVLPQVTSPDHTAAAPQPGSAPAGGRRRRRRRGGRGRGRGSPPLQARTGGSPPAAQPAPPAAAKPPRPDPRGRRDRGGYRRRVKEVYMGGKWVKVEGEGPVISTD